MEKLIELIGEWQKEMHPDGIYLPVVAYRDGIFWSDSDCLSSVMDGIHLISKPCSFIKRLVEKDKIDRAKFGNSETKSSKYSDFELSYDTPREDYINILLMELAIQDEPIEYLVSVLK